MRDKTDRHTQALLAGSMLVTLLLYFVIPYGRDIGRPLLWLSTLVHELGHGVAAVLVGGEFLKFQMWWDGSGVATHRGHYGAFSRAFISMGGLLGPPFAAAVGLWLGGKRERAKGALVGFGAILLICLAWVVRGAFGVGFTAAVAVVLIALGLKGSAKVAQAVILFLSSQLALATFSRADYLFTPTARTGAGEFPSDVGQIAENLWLPYWFWGGLCAVLSVALLALGLYLFQRGLRKA